MSAEGWVRALSERLAARVAHCCLREDLAVSWLLEVAEQLEQRPSRERHLAWLLQCAALLANSVYVGSVRSVALWPWLSLSLVCYISALYSDGRLGTPFGFALLTAGAAFEIRFWMGVFLPSWASGVRP